MGKVDFISQIVASFGGGAECVHRGRDYARRGFLIVEDGKGGGDQDGKKDRNGTHPAHAILGDICWSVRYFDSAIRVEVKYLEALDPVSSSSKVHLLASAGQLTSSFELDFSLT